MGWLVSIDGTLADQFLQSQRTSLKEEHTAWIGFNRRHAGRSILTLVKTLVKILPQRQVSIDGTLADQFLQVVSLSTDVEESYTRFQSTARWQINSYTAHNGSIVYHVLSP